MVQVRSPYFILYGGFMVWWWHAVAGMALVQLQPFEVPAKELTAVDPSSARQRGRSLEGLMTDSTCYRQVFG